MPTFPDLAEIYDPHLHLPIGEKTYTVLSPNARDGVRLHQYFVQPSLWKTGADQLEAMFRLLGAEPYDDGTDTLDYRGGLLDEMVDDGLHWLDIWRVGQTALLYFGLRNEAWALAFWAYGKAASFPPREPEGADDDA